MEHKEVSFGSIVKERRRSLDLTQAELARRVGCAIVTIRKVEYDALRPSQQIAELLAKALVIPLKERSAFVRLGRTAGRATSEPSPLPTPPPTPDEIGQSDLSGRAIRGYELGERLGAGGFGVVYRAVQPLVEREVAIKIILPQYADHPEFIRRFEAEAQLVARLEHPHIVPLYDYWREPGVAYLVMRLLRGGSLQAKLRDGPLALDVVLSLLEQIGAALHAAHRAGVVHRDLKPANVLLDEDGNSYVADFGIAKNLNLESQTQAGAIIGSPAYLSPEQILSEPIKPQTDIYCLGLMLYELLTGHKPFPGPTPVEYLQQHLSVPLPSLTGWQPDLPVDLDQVIERATAKDPLDRYPDVPSMLAEVRGAVMSVSGAAAVSQVPYTAVIADEKLENPYKGLRAFGEADADDFFGRDTLTQELLGRLAEPGDLTRFLAVVGPSGSGKSSVVKAGLIPALRRGGLPGSENWFIVDLVPGAHPWEELEAALLRVAVTPPKSLLTQLREDERGLLRAVRRVLPEDEATELVLVIDQFEEIFTLTPTEAERAQLLDSLVMAVLDPRSRARVVITLRADFTDRPLQYVDFGELVCQRTEFVLPLAPDELEEAIIKPAQRVGLAVEPGLPETIIADLGDQPGTLPLLQYTLTELFGRRVGRSLTLGAYQASGGVRSALAKRADELYTQLDEVGQKAARQLFLRLITLGEATGDGRPSPDTRRRVLRSELTSLDGRPKTTSVIDGVIDQFGRHRLLTFDRDPVTRGPTVEVAHEALIREWDRLRGWLDEDREFLLWGGRLRAALHQWEASDRDQGALLRGAPLAEAESWSNQRRADLSQVERAFIQASLDLREQRAAEREAQRQRELEAARKLAETEKARAEAESRRAEEQTRAAGQLRQRAFFLLGALVIAGILAIVAVIFGRQAEREARLATSRELAAAAINNLEVDPELGVLLALQAVSEANTHEAENALHQAMPTLHILQTLSKHADAVEDVAYSPDGKRLATVSEDWSVIIWEVTPDGVRDLLTLPEGSHTAPVTGVAFSPDGKRLATASEDGTAKVWEVDSGRELLALTEQAGLRYGYHMGAMKVEFSPDGTRLATANLDGVPKVWDATSGEELLALPGHTELVTDIAFSPDGKRLATASEDATAKIWDISAALDAGATTGKEMFTLSGHVENVICLAFSPDGSRLATVGYEEVAKVWDAATGQELFTLVGHQGWINGVVFSPDGKRLATGSYDGTARVWDAATGRELLTLTGHRSTVHTVAFSPDGGQLATASYDGTAKIWDTAPGRELLTLVGHAGSVEAVATSPDGSYLVTAGGDGTAKMWDATTGQELLTLPEEGYAGPPFRSVAYRPECASSPEATEEKCDALLAAGTVEGTVIVWRIEFSSAGDVISGHELLTLSAHDNWVFGLAFSPECMGPPGASVAQCGTRLVTSSLDGTAKVWLLEPSSAGDVASGQELLALVGHTDSVWDLAYSPDGKLLATTGWDDTVRIWDAFTGEELLTLPTGGLHVFDADFSPDGTRLAAGTQDGTTIMWEIGSNSAGDAISGRELFTMSGHTGNVIRLAFSPDGTRLATASFDSTAKVWDVATGQELLTLFGNATNVSGVIFSPDGRRLVTSGFDGTARIYVLPIEELVALAQSRVTRSLTTEECQRFLHVDACPAGP